MSDNPQDTTIEIIPEDQFLTWEELSTPRVVRKFVPKLGKYIEFLSMIPMDELAAIQARYMGKDQKDFAGYFIAVLRKIMVKPSLKSDDAVRAAKRADGGLLSEIVTTVLGTKEAEDFEKNWDGD